MVIIMIIEIYSYRVNLVSTASNVIRKGPVRN